MSLNRFAKRRDKNEKPLVEIIRALGGYVFTTGPLDAWIYVRNQWHLCEIKDPKREGWASEYTQSQKALLASLNALQIPFHTLRTEEDVFKLITGREQ